MNTTDIGLAGETEVVNFLEGRGYKIIETNWKTATCEIDIIALHGTTMHFVEVKYRSNDKSGSGLECITKQKLSRMGYAARMWSSRNNWPGQIVLSGASVAGKDAKVDFIESICG